MSKPITQHRASFTDVKAALTSNVAETSTSILAYETAFIDSNSILKAGDVQTKVLSDLDTLQDAVEHAIDTTAAANELHFIDTCKKVFTRVYANLRVLILENQEWFVKNESNVKCWIARSHVAPDGTQHMRTVKVLAPGETGILHG